MLKTQRSIVNPNDPQLDHREKLTPMNNAKRPNVHTKSVHGKLARINSIHEKDQQPTRFYTHFRLKLIQANHAATSDSSLNDCASNRHRPPNCVSLSTLPPVTRPFMGSYPAQNILRCPNNTRHMTHRPPESIVWMHSSVTYRSVACSYSPVVVPKYRRLT